MDWSTCCLSTGSCVHQHASEVGRMKKYSSLMSAARWLIAAFDARRWWSNHTAEIGLQHPARTQCVWNCPHNKLAAFVCFRYCTHQTERGIRIWRVKRRTRTLKDAQCKTEKKRKSTWRKIKIEWNIKRLCRIDPLKLAAWRSPWPAASLWPL